MLSQRLRSKIATHCVWWCAAWVLMAALQPFMAVHFRRDGWEDEPAFRFHTAGESAQFEPDDRADHSGDIEATVFVPASASIDVPHAFQSGLDGLMALVLLSLPLLIALAALAVPAQPLLAQRIPRARGPPPDNIPFWRLQPPKNAPPLTT
ncbi:hypothetical protein [Rhodoferax sp.]|uniref:hypothetical protein n=1 Tax=Rhodoferax sp. TaxID=50421 RepID=UPI00374D9607